MKYYFYIENRYESPNKPMRSGHVVRANSKREATEICEKYGIANPMGAEVRSRKVTLLDPAELHQSILISRRRKGIGGKIFYEQDNQLKIEKE